MNRLFITILLFIFSFNSQAMLVFHSAYWSGCVRSRVKDLGQTKGKIANFCKKKAQVKKFKRFPFEEVNNIKEEARFLFYEGCLVGNATTNDREVDEKCHILTKSFFFDMEDILNQEVGKLK